MHISKLAYLTSNTVTVKKITKECLMWFVCIEIRFVFFFYSFDVMLYYSMTLKHILNNSYISIFYCA